MPRVVLVDVDTAFRCQHVEGCELEVGQRRDVPAVAAIGVDIVADGLRARLGSVEERAHACRDVAAALSSGRERADGGGERRRGRRADRRVLRSQEFLGLHGPRHQLAVEASPVGFEIPPQVGCLEGGAHAREQPGLKSRVGEEPAAGSGEANAALRTDDAESLARDLIVAAHDKDGARAMCFSSHTTLGMP